jgi:predicted O-methyltransferase YrrM
MFSERLSNLLVPHIRTISYLDMWAVRPMNGQRNRLKTSFLLSEILGPDIAIESGSYLGTTTQYLASFASQKTYSIEINKQYASVAKDRLKADIETGRVEIIEGNSAQHFPQIFKTINPQTSKIFAYLDAHWLENIPLMEEIQSLLDWGGDFIAVIDDFYIPQDLGYGYDLYENHRVDITHIPVSNEISVWIPSEKSNSESGARRGTAYIISKNLREIVAKQSEHLNLRPY